jgi:uncharacterized protein DUF1902
MFRFQEFRCGTVSRAFDAYVVGLAQHDAGVPEPSVAAITMPTPPFKGPAMIVRIRAEYDPEAAVWVAESDDIPLITQAKTIKALRAKLPGLIFDLIGEPATALVRYSAPRPGGSMAAERIAASPSAMICTAAWWLIETLRSRPGAALRFSLVQAVPPWIRSRIMTSMSSSSIALPFEKTEVAGCDPAAKTL